jgi:pilus assembly protein TadC
MVTQKSSIVTDDVYRLKEGQLYLPTWGVIVVLVISLVILKSFIYIKDQKRNGK